MRKLAVILSLALPTLTSYAEIYKQVDPATGEVIYTNFRPKKAAEAVVVIDELIDDWVPPKIKPEKKADTPKIDYSKTEYSTNTSSSSSSTTHTSRSSSKSRYVEIDNQRERGDERRKILVDELRREETSLQEATTKSAPVDIIERHKANIVALQREIGRLK